MLASFSISACENDHLSCRALSADGWRTFMSHQSPQLVRKMRSLFSGKSDLVNAARMLLAPIKY